MIEVLGGNVSSLTQCVGQTVTLRRTDVKKNILIAIVLLRST